MSQSGFNLEKLKDVVKEGELAAHPELIRLLSNSSSVATTCKAHKQAGKYSDSYMEKLRLISTTKLIEFSHSGFSHLGIKKNRSSKNVSVVP